MSLYTGVTGRTGECAEHHLAVTFTAIIGQKHQSLTPQAYLK